MVKPAKKCFSWYKVWINFMPIGLQLLEVAMARILQGNSRYFAQKLANCPFSAKTIQNPLI